MTRVKLTRAFFAMGVNYPPDSVAEMEANQAAYLLGMGSVEASAAAVTTPPVIPPRIDNRPGTMGSAAKRMLGIDDGIAFSAYDDSCFIKDTITPANNYDGKFTTKLGSVRTGPATMFDSTGKIVWGPENLLLWSEDLTNVAWQKTLAETDVVSNADTAPDGTLTADRVYPTGNGARRFRQPITKSAEAIVYTISAYFKAGGKNWIILQGTDIVSAGVRRWFNTATGAIGTSASFGSGVTLLDTKVTPSAPGWYRCSITIQSSIGTQIGIEIIPSDGDGVLTVTANGTDGIYMWGAQIERAAAASTYKPTTSAAYYGLRIDYNPRSGEPGYLIEPAGTNLLLNSIWAGGPPPTPSWSTPSAGIGTVEPSIYGSEDGAKALRIITNAERYQLIQSAFAVTAGNTYTLSVYVEDIITPVGCNQVLQATGLPAGTTVTWHMNGVQVANPNLGLQIGRLELKAVVTTTGTLNVSVGCGTSGNSNGNIKLSRPQFEQGIVASSFIPTTTATVTRSGDTPYLPYTDIPYGVEGTLYAKASYNGMPSGAVNSIMTGNTNPIDNRQQLYFYNNTNIGFNVRDVGVTQCDLSISGIGPNIKYKLAARYKLNDLALSKDGAPPLTDTVGTVVLGTNLYFGNNQGNVILNGYLYEGMVSKRAYTNYELQVRAS